MELFSDSYVRIFSFISIFIVAVVGNTFLGKDAKSESCRFCMENYVVVFLIVWGKYTCMVHNPLPLGRYYFLDMLEVIIYHLKLNGSSSMSLQSVVSSGMVFSLNINKYFTVKLKQIELENCQRKGSDYAIINIWN